MKLASFDLEIAQEMPEGLVDWRDCGLLGIACAAVALSDATDEVAVWHRFPRLTRQGSQKVVRHLQGLVNAGYTLLTWNGCWFDFAVLARESGLAQECAHLALNHVDLMLLVTFTKGHYLGLEKALQGAGLGGKLKEITLSDGTRLSGMDGSQAPNLWARGECEAVLTYLRHDAAQTLLLAGSALRTGSIRWISNSGRPQAAAVDRLLTVERCFGLPEPDVSWMTDPPQRHRFVSWMPSGIAPLRPAPRKRAPVA